MSYTCTGCGRPFHYGAMGGNQPYCHDEYGSCYNKRPRPTIKDVCPHTQRGVTWAEGNTTCYVCETCEHEWTETANE